MSPSPDSLSWTVKIIPYAKRCTRAQILGLGEGYLLFNSTGRVGYEKPYLYDINNDTHHKLEFEKNHWLAFAHKNWIAGCAPQRDQASLACAWQVGEDAVLTKQLLHDDNWSMSNTSGANPYGIFGYASAKGEDGAYAAKWSGENLTGYLYGEKNHNSRMLASDGASHVGHAYIIGEGKDKATLWRDGQPETHFLHPDRFNTSKALAVNGECQFGYAHEPMETQARVRAAMWKGTPESFTDMTPHGFQQAVIRNASSGFQVGFASADSGLMLMPDSTPTGDTHAHLWSGQQATGFDLHTLLPPETLRSDALFIEEDDQTLKIYGNAWAIDKKGEENSSVVIWQGSK